MSIPICRMICQDGVEEQVLSRNSQEKTIDKQAYGEYNETGAH